MLDQWEAECREKFINMDFSGFDWKTVPGTGEKPGYRELTLGSELDPISYLYTLSALTRTDCIVSLSIRKYPRRYFIALVLSPDPDSDLGDPDYTQDGDGDGIISTQPVISIILYRFDHNVFEQNSREILSDLFTYMIGADFDALYVAAYMKIHYSMGRSHGA